MYSEDENGDGALLLYNTDAKSNTMFISTKKKII